MDNLYVYEVSSFKVIDGDTIDVTISLGFEIDYKIRIRVAGINTPETRTRNIKEKKAGKIAKQAVKDWFETSEVTYVKTIKDSKGKFGRYLADFYWGEVTKEKSLSKFLLDKGLCVKYGEEFEEGFFDTIIENYPETIQK